VQDPQARTALKSGDFEEAAAPECVQRDFLQDLLCGLLLLKGVLGVVEREALADDFNQDRALRRGRSKTRSAAFVCTRSRAFESESE